MAAQQTGAVGLGFSAGGSLIWSRRAALSTDDNTGFMRLRVSRRTCL